MAASERSGNLERTLSLKAALAIGIGTMVGAGIFVFPGIAAGKAGPAASISFAVAGLIALLVAMVTAEMATAMPASGGGYYFVSRAFGPVWGTVVGIAQWLGLVFACAFYLVGFAQYTIDLLQETGYNIGDPEVLIALGIALLLTLINLVGTKGVGRLQNYIVLILTLMLSLLFGYGIFSALGLIGSARPVGTFAPKGISPILTTTALIFTSYLGFVQIAAVGGEIRHPQKNLPRALIGSVLIVTLLYILTIIVSTTVLPVERLASLGETAMVEVARELLGGPGAIIILGAGLLATLSSANASILSSSRAVYALGSDQLLPPFFSRISRRFGTPYSALLLVGCPIAGVVLMGRIEILAEVASLLHLCIYGMICLTLLRLRKDRPIWFVPTFRAPGGWTFPLLGALSCFGLIFLMQPLSLVIGAGVLVGALAWYFVYAKGTELSNPQPPHIAPELRNPRILMPIEVPDPSPLPHPILSPFRSLEVLVLGYKVMPEQTNPQQAREKYGDQAQSEIGKIVAQLDAEGINASSELIFTPNIDQSINRYLEEHQCQAVLTVKPIDNIRRLLVPIYHHGQISKRLATILLDLSNRQKIPIQVLILGSDEQGADNKISRLLHAVVQQLQLSGLSSGQFQISSEKVDQVAKAVSQKYKEEDLIILAESQEFDRNSFFKNVHRKIFEGVNSPVLVVLYQRSD